MVDPIKTNGLRQVPARPAAQLEMPVVKQATSFQAPPKVQAPSRAQAQAPQAPAPIKDQPQPRSDTIELSQAAQARLLRLQGMSIPEIAQQLRLDITTVNGFFPK